MRSSRFDTTARMASFAMPTCSTTSETLHGPASGGLATNASASNPSTTSMNRLVAWLICDTRRGSLSTSLDEIECDHAHPLV